MLDAAPHRCECAGDVYRPGAVEGQPSPRVLREQFDHPRVVGPLSDVEPGVAPECLYRAYDANSGSAETD